MTGIAKVAVYSITRPEQLRDLSDEELLNLHRRLHQIDAVLRENHRAREYLTINRHVWVVEEMLRRGFHHNVVDALDRDSLPLLEKGFSLSWLAQRLAEAEDVVLVPAYVSLVGSAPNEPDPNDLDVLVRDDEAVLDKGWRESVLLLTRALLDPEKTGLKLHLLANPRGPHLIPGRGYVPLYDLVLRPRKPLEVLDRAAQLTPLSHYRAQKPAMLGYTDFVDLDELWEAWAKEAIQDTTLLVSPKVDGFRVMLGKAVEHAQAWSEDFKRDYTERLQPILDELPPGILVEGELVAARSERWLARPQVASFLAGNEDAEPYVFLYDLLVWDGKDVHEQPFSERYALLKQLSGEHIVVLPQEEADDREALERAVRAMNDWSWRWGGPPIEGVIVRMATMPYVFGSTTQYAKVKRYLELKVEVVRVNRKDNGWTYTCALRDDESDDPVIIGDTFVSKEKLADEGDTLNVAIEELLVQPDGSLAWGKPTPLGVDRSRPAYTVRQAIDLARRYGVLKEYVTDAVSAEDIEDETRGERALAHWEQHWHEAMPLSGKALPFVLHAHVRGLSEEEAQRVIDGEWGLDDIIAETNHSLHFDLRLATDRGSFWWGITLFAGSMADNRDTLRIFRMMEDPDEKIQSAPKQFGPLSWLDVGKDAPLVVPPGGVGSTSRRWSAFFAVDWGTWRLGFARQHAVEIWLDGNTLSGRFMWQYAEAEGGRRFWLFTRPADQVPYAKTHDRDEVIDEVRKRGQRYLVWPKDPDRLEKGCELIDVTKLARIIRSEPVKRYTLAVAYPIREVDAHGEAVLDPDVLEEMAWDYMRRHRSVGLLHQPGTEGAGEVVESYIYRGPRWEVNGEIVEPGDWLLGVVWREDVWERIVRGEFTGYSIQGWAQRVARRKGDGQ